MSAQLVGVRYPGGCFVGHIEDDSGTLLWACDHCHLSEFQARECAYKESRRGARKHRG